MVGEASLSPALLKRPSSALREEERGLAAWQRRTLEALVAVLAFAVWGTLAYRGGFRLLARIEDMPVSGHWVIDALSLLIGVSGSIAGVSALWAIGMRALGRTPMSLVGAPDDSPADAAYRTGEYAVARSRGSRQRPTA
jgi:hypothetical protein